MVSKVIPSNTNVASWGSGVEEHQVKSLVAQGIAPARSPKRRGIGGRLPHP